MVVSFSVSVQRDIHFVTILEGVYHMENIVAQEVHINLLFIIVVKVFIYCIYLNKPTSN